MVKQSAVITNALGFHLRTAAAFAEEMGKYPCKVTVIYNDTALDGKSTLSLMAACIRCGCEIEVVCEGELENEALSAAMDIIHTM